MQEKSCETCKYSLVKPYNEPCFNCNMNSAINYKCYYEVDPLLVKIQKRAALDNMFKNLLDNGYSSVEIVDSLTDVLIEKGYIKSEN